MRRFLILVLLLVLTISLSAKITQSSPGKAAQSVISVGVFEKNLAKTGEISIYVLGNKKVASNLKNYLNQKIGKAKLKQVKYGETLPSEKPDILFLGQKKKVEQVKKYCRKNNVLSITNLPSLVNKGITMGIGMQDGQTQLVLNPDSTKKEGVKWKSAIMKIAKVNK